jgi:hypothetical protein
LAAVVVVDPGGAGRLARIVLVAGAQRLVG